MRSSDLRQVLAIERNAQISPWARLSFESALTEHYWCRCLLLEGVIIGYLVAQPVLDELHILNVVIDPSKQGMGASHELMSDAFDYCAVQGVKRLFLEVRASNTVAQSLYQKWGFEKLAVRTAYYHTKTTGQREDALVFTRELITEH